MGIHFKTMKRIENIVNAHLLQVIDRNTYIRKCYSLL